MVRVLYSAMERVQGLRLSDIRGGRFDNVICPKNQAEVAVPADRAGDFEEFIREFGDVLTNEYAGCDSGIALRCEKTELNSALSVKVTFRMLRTLLALPQGVQAMSVDFPGLVQTSMNLGVMGMEEDGLHFSISVRSSIASQKAMAVQKVRAIVGSERGTVIRQGDYPGWQYNRQSALREDVLAAYKTVSGRDGVIQGTHGGLECGLFAEKIPGLDVVSAGPELRDIHSYQERLNVLSVRRVYEMTCELLRRSR